MEKVYTATQKYVQTTPRKLRLVADAVKKLTPIAALEVLPYSSKRAANPLYKVVKTAVSNAKQDGVLENELVFSEIQITQGPVLKRFSAVSRGQAHGYKKRMSHVRVSVKRISQPEKKQEVVETKEVVNTEKVEKKAKKQIKK